MPRRFFFSALLVMFLAGSAGARVAADAAESASVKSEVDELNSAVSDKRKRVKEIDSLISGYRAKIKAQEARQATLGNEVLLLDNRIKEKELAILRAKTEIEALTLEIESLERVIAEQELRIAKQRDLIAEFIRRLNQADEVRPIDVLLTHPSLSSFFDRLEELKRLERDLGETIEGVKTAKKTLEESKRSRDERRTDLVEEERTLEKDQEALESEKNFKFSLIAQTEESQQEFERILYELRQQQQSTAEDIHRLEEQLKDTLASIDDALARGDILLNWPVPPLRGVSAHFHDRDYPFRNLFEHPGTDIPTPVGTPVKAAAGGYVAWNKTGRMYGNYTMIVHPGGIATVYAHLSKFVAKPDTYVERGDVIALSGGKPGAPGAGLSTGPHVHFEVRQNGIPVNAESFLPDVE
ncbi:peptidoglycan DD-metalloendopeptidase family protein [Candidatus Uhrbacteria bacterium]|nr:peptidoglycan DD-metalloendopeptidase family protein [Candidatus Uhrbacteria bacterium]